MTSPEAALDASIAKAFVAACRAEIEAPKPGNVHVFAGGHDMEAKHFLDAAAAAAPFIADRTLIVGERIRRAVAASMAVAGTNTNLGIVLLAAPLAAAAQTGGPDLRQSLRGVLSGLTLADAEGAFAAIAHANPGGLGERADNDVRGRPTTTLAAAMAAAADRDRIARAYGTDYADVWDVGLQAYRAAEADAVIPWWPATAAFLAFLAAFPDSHIVRKWGAAAAGWVQAEAVSLKPRLEELAPEARLEALLDLDARIKANGWNPGTSADLTVATIFSRMLDPILRKSVESG
ncbi:MAG: triphosphoribosyl-dephospho-CoA synthase [Hyphomicrobiales bacterium]